jgi:hypothetical protein
MKIILSMATAALMLAGCSGGATAEPPAAPPTSPSPAAASPSAAAVASSPASPEADPTCDVVARVRAELPELSVGPIDDEMAAQYQEVVTALQYALSDLQAEAEALPDTPLADDYRMGLALMQPKTALYLSQLGDWSISDGGGSRQLKEFGATITDSFDDVLADCPA